MVGHFIRDRPIEKVDQIPAEAKAGQPIGCALSRIGF